MAVVTGAARNIGRAIALDLARGGAAVVVNARVARGDAEGVAREIESEGGSAIAWMADVTDPVAVGRMFAAAAARFGRLDILVNNAAVREEWPFEQIPLADWRRVIGIVLDGAFLCAQAAVPAMRSAGGGTIVNIGGETGHTGAPERAHVVTAKAGLAGFTKALAHDLAPFAITANCVAPGAMNTPGSRMSRHPQSTFVKKRVPPVGRTGEPWEVAAMVRMLCGPGARYVTGQVIHVNGGYSMY